MEDEVRPDWPFLLGVSYIFPVWVLMTFYLQTVPWIPSAGEWFHVVVQITAAFILPLAIARNVRRTQRPLARGLLTAVVTAGLVAPFYLIQYSVRFVATHRRDAVLTGRYGYIPSTEPPAGEEALL